MILKISRIEQLEAINYRLYFVQNQVVWLGGGLLLLHQFRQHKVQRRHQADHVQLHAVHLRRRDVLSTEPNSDDSSLQWIVTMT